MYLILLITLSALSVGTLYGIAWCMDEWKRLGKP